MWTRSTLLVTTIVLLGIRHPTVATAQEQNPLDLELVSGGAIGQSLIWSVSGQDPFPGILQALGVDFDLLPEGLELVGVGTLELAATPGLIVLPGDGTGFYALGVPDLPSLQGIQIHAQAVATALGAPSNTFVLSNTVSTTLANTNPVGRFVHTLHLADGTLSTYGLDPDGGRPRPLGVVDAGALPTTFAVSSDGRFVWAVDAAQDVVRTFQLDPSTGRLDASAVVNCDPSTYAVAVDPAGKLLVTASSATETVRTYRLDLATGTPLTTSAAGSATVAGPIDIAYDPIGRAVHVLSSTEHTVHSFAVNTVSGELSLLNVTEVGEGASALELDVKGTRGFVSLASSGWSSPTESRPRRGPGSRTPPDRRSSADASAPWRRRSSRTE